MNPKAVLLIIITVIVAAILIGWLFYRQAGVRRAKLRKMTERVKHAEKTLRTIEEKARIYSDLESPLATEIRIQLDQYYATRTEIDY